MDCESELQGHSGLLLEEEIQSIYVTQIVKFTYLMKMLKLNAGSTKFTDRQVLNSYKHIKCEHSNFNLLKKVYNTADYKNYC